MQERTAVPGHRADEASQILKALGSPRRLMIACRLADGEATVGALAARLGVRESVVSQHLAVLRRERLVSARRDGQLIHYALKSEAARDILGALARSFC